MTGYQYRGGRGTLTDEEVRSRVDAARAKAAGNGEAAQQPDAAKPAHPQKLKGAVKVEAFPDRSKYPFQAIADDGGIWKLDPAAFKAKTNSVYQASLTWAKKHDLEAKSVIDDGLVYVQFTRRGGAS